MPKTLPIGYRPGIVGIAEKCGSKIARQTARSIQDSKLDDFLGVMRPTAQARPPITLQVIRRQYPEQLKELCQNSSEIRSKRQNLSFPPTNPSNPLT
jgi:hypothetical protein